jgi:serine/threonine protein kinase
MSNEDTIIGNYQVLSTIAYGSFGRVYLARHNMLASRTVALKLMHSVPLSSDEEHQQFLHEAKILELLKHPFIVPILDVGIHDGRPYIVSEYAEGGSLRQYLKERRGKHCELEKALTILSQIGQGLQYAHQQNVIHRDIKPENILFNGKGEALLADFGLATMLATASVKYVTNAGTPRYMAPEQFQGKISKETDQYALGCIAYELLTGHALFEGTDPVTFMYQHVQVAPTPLTEYNPQLSPSIEQAVLKALSKQRQDRYADVEAFIDALSVPTAPLALTTQAATATLPSAEQEATEANYTTNPSGDTTVSRGITEENINTVVDPLSNGHAQSGEESASTTIIQAKQPASRTIQLVDDHSTQPILPKKTLSDSNGLPSSFIRKKPGRGVYAVAAMFLVLVLITSSLLWIWQTTYSTKTVASSVPSGTISPTLTIIVSPTITPTLTPTATATSKVTATATTISAAIPISATATPIAPTAKHIAPTATPRPPTATPIPPTPTPIAPTVTPTVVPLKLVANPTDLSNVTSCPISGSSTWTCTVTLSTSSGAQGSIQWTSTNNVQGCRETCTPSSTVIISPSSGTLNAGDTVQVSISADFCYPTRLVGSIIFTGPANTITIPFACDGSPS